MDIASLASAFMGWSQGMIGTFGYLGVFVVSLVSSASIFLPVPGFLFILAAGAFLNPVVLGLVAGAGSAIGEMTGFGLGRGGSHALKSRDVKWLKRGEKWFRKGRGFLVIFAFAATPLPDDVTGILAGMFKYEWKKFLLAAFLGKTLLNLLLAFAGLYGSSAFLSMLGIGS